MRAAIFDEESKGQKYEWKEIPADLKAEVRRAARQDDRSVRRHGRRHHGEVLGRQRRPGHAKREIVARARARGARSFKFIPVLCGSAFKNKGVQLLLDAVVNYLPSPLDIPPVEGINPDNNKPKIVRKADDERALRRLRLQDHQRSVRQLDVLPRLLGAARRAATMVMNSTRGKRERIGRILRMHANKREELTECMRWVAVGGALGVCCAWSSG